MILTRKLSQLHWPAAAISSRVYLIFADCIPIICCLKPHGTASFPRVCLPSHQAKFSGLRASFPGCPKGDSGPKVPLGASCNQKCAAQLLRGHQRVLVRLGSLQNWIVSTTWSNSKHLSRNDHNLWFHGASCRRGNPHEFRHLSLGQGLSSASGYDLLQPSRV
jgi:hypothetical protein